MAVLNVYLNGQPFSQGRISLEEIVAKLDTGAAERKGARAERKKRLMTCWWWAVVGKRRRGHLCRPQRHSHRHCRRTFRWPGDGHRRHRELHLRALHRGPKLAASLGSTSKRYGVEVITEQRAAAISSRMDLRQRGPRLGAP